MAEILLFAGLREHLRATSLEIAIEDGWTVADLLSALQARYPAILPLLAACRVAVDLEFVKPDTPIRSGAEIALIPPVSGGQGHDPERVCLTSEPLVLDRLTTAVSHAGAGGLVTFTGHVRSASRGLAVTHLEYEAYGPMALHGLWRIVREIETEIPGCRVAIHHRTGRLQIGEAAVMIAASAAHRGPAFDACRTAIERLKSEVPIWKKEFTTDGQVWVGQGP